MATKLGQDSGGDNDSRVAEASRLLEMLDGHGDELAPNEQKFVTDLRERFEQYGPRTMVSAKQLFWLRDIKDKSL